MSSDSDHSLLLELYKTRRQYFISQGNRIWTRFYYFLTTEIALAGVYLVEGGSPGGTSRVLLVPFLGILCSLLWYLIGAQDLYFYEGYRQGVAVAEELVLSKLGSSIAPTSKHLQEIKPTPFRFKIKHVGVTTFAAICPVLFLVLWTLSFFVR